jgi:hypothetical protein
MNETVDTYDSLLQNFNAREFAFKQTTIALSNSRP